MACCACCALSAWLQREWSREGVQFRVVLWRQSSAEETHTLEESRGKVSGESVPLQGGNVTEENMITWVIANALYLWFYLLLSGLLHDVLGRLAGFNNNHCEPNALGDKGTLQWSHAILAPPQQPQHSRSGKEDVLNESTPRYTAEDVSSSSSTTSWEEYSHTGTSERSGAEHSKSQTCS